MEAAASTPVEDETKSQDGATTLSPPAGAAVPIEQSESDQRAELTAQLARLRHQPVDSDSSAVQEFYKQQNQHIDDMIAAFEHVSNGGHADTEGEYSLKVWATISNDVDRVTCSRRDGVVNHGSSRAQLTSELSIRHNCRRDVDTDMGCTVRRNLDTFTCTHVCYACQVVLSIACVACRYARSPVGQDGVSGPCKLCQQRSLVRHQDRRCHFVRLTRCM